jgi:DNA polymerase-1
MPAPLLAVDAPSMLYRAFYALPDSIKGADGKPVNALLGTANLVLAEIETHAPRAVAICFGAEAAAYRTELLGSYHADRPEMPEGLVGQWEDADAFFSAFGWTVASDDRLEADDLLGSLARLEEEAGGEALLLTGDRDMYQCATKAVKVLYVRTGKRGAERVGPGEVRTKYGIGPELVPDFIALRGDPSDGIPGAKGVGEKTAAELLREHGSLEALLDNALKITRPKLRTTLVDSREQLLEFKDIATLRKARVKRPKDRETDWAGASKAAAERGMNRLGERLAKIGDER